MAAIHARTESEVTEYISLATSECVELGSTIVETLSYSDNDDGEWTSHYDLECLNCGLEWHFDVTVDPEPDSVDDAAQQYGFGTEPSQLIDAGQWYLVFARWLAVGREIQERQGSSSPLEVPELARMVTAFDLARAALDEVPKFIPAGLDRVPESALWTDQGRWSCEEEPALLVRDQLEKLRGQMVMAHDFCAQQYRQINRESA